MKTSENDFHIDLNRLDYEWVRQPELYYEYATQLADAKKEEQVAKQTVDVVKAEVDTDVRERPGNYGLEKITEPAIANKIAESKRYKAAVSAHINARHAVEILVAAVGALDHKKKGLENLVDLRLANYFSEPHAKSDGSRDAMNEAGKRRARKAQRDE